RFADLEREALAHDIVMMGSSGSVIERSNAGGFRFYAHQYYDGRGRKREHYLAGPIGSPNAHPGADGLRAPLAPVEALGPSLRMLGREGFALVDPATYATVASVHNRGVFRKGAMLIGSHAYGVLLNRMGIRAAPYATEDIDIARAGKLVLDDVPEGGLLEIL